MPLAGAGFLRIALRLMVCPVSVVGCAAGAAFPTKGVRCEVVGRLFGGGIDSVARVLTACKTKNHPPAWLQEGGFLYNHQAFWLFIFS